MSASLCWKPVSRECETLPDALKFVLRDKHGLRDKEVWGISMVPYLNGLVDAGVDGAQELIDAIGKHEEVEIWLEY